MISVREALDTVLGAVAPLAPERVGLLDAAGRVIAEDVRSLRDVPGYANSAMDGYAVRAADLSSGSTRLRVVGVIPAGAPLPLPRVGAGEAVKIMTGGAVPPGADTVVKVEDTDGGSETVEIREAPKPGANVREAAEDIASGATVLERGRRISPADVGLLASIGRSFIQVHRRPSVAIVSTGDELVEADEEVTPGRVVNSNAYSLAAAIAEAGAIPVLLPIARDTPDSIRAVFVAASRHDAILSTGGVSVGEFDYVKSVMDELGVRAPVLEGRAEARQAAHVRHARLERAVRPTRESGLVARLLLPLRAPRAPAHGRARRDPSRLGARHARARA